MGVTRRQFMKVSAAGLAASSVGALGFIDAGEVLAAGVRPYRLEKATETRNACPYCAVACGVLIYSMADGTGKDARQKVVHIEGDADRAALDELIAHANVWSPVANTVRNPVPLTVSLAAAK